MYDLLRQLLPPTAALIVWLICFAAFLYGLLPWTRDVAAPLTPGRRGWLWVSRILFVVVTVVFAFTYVLH